MEIYHYDPDTRIFTGAGMADPNPEDADDWLVPACATPKLPPACADGEQARFDAERDDWEVIPVPTAAEQLVTQLEGVELEDLRARALALIDSQASLTEAGGLGLEYQVAWLSALQWLADTSRLAPARIQALAEVKGLTEKEAAELVVAKWDAAAAKVERQGAARLRAKAAIRAAVTAEEVTAAYRAGIEAMHKAGEVQHA